jgi:hypothetical protein
MSITLDLIIKKATDKFISDVESDLWKYERFLEESIRKGGEKAEEKKLLKEVRLALGQTGTVKVMKEVEEPKDDWKAKKKKKEAFFKKAAADAIEEHFID